MISTQIVRLAFGITAAVGILLTITPNSAFAESAEFTPDLTNTLVAPYLAIHKGLAADQLDAAKQGAEEFFKATESAPQHGDAKKATEALAVHARAISEATDIAAARKAFRPLTREFVTLLKKTGTTDNTPLYLVHCPMAFGNSGADWVQADKTVANPYFGASMLRCGGVKADIKPE